MVSIQSSQAAEESGFGGRSGIAARNEIAGASLRCGNERTIMELKLGIRRVALASTFVTSAAAVSACGGVTDSSAHDEAEQTLGNRTPRVIETRTLAPLAGKLY